MVTKDMGIMEVVEMYPQLIDVFKNQFGMGCVGCLAASYESIEDGARAHEVDINVLMVALNAAI